VVAVARELREVHGFRGYIHLKTIPEASPELLAEAGRYADRLSINIEMPREQSLKELAPEKDFAAIRRSMARMRARIDEAREGEATARRPATKAAAPRFAPAGQSTQMVVGADAADDRAVLGTSVNLYGSYRLKRVYYSAYSPIPDASSLLPPQPPPLLREHRLYQADWLLRFYGFELDEIMAGAEGGMLDLGVDPKLAWALRHRESFPVDVNRAPREMLLRVPGLGAKTVEKIIAARRHRSVRAEDLARLRLSLPKLLPFLVTADHRPRGNLLDRPDLRRLVAPKASAFGALALPTAAQLALL
jgi:putative DNA modification/repair radical SAM protein